MSLFFKALPERLKYLFASLNPQAQFQLYLYMTGQSPNPPPGVPPQIFQQQASNQQQNHRHHGENSDLDSDYDDDSDSALQFSDEEFDEEINRILRQSSGHGRNGLRKGRGLSRQSSLSSISSLQHASAGAELAEKEEPLDRVLRSYDPKHILPKVLRDKQIFRKRYLYDFSEINPKHVANRKLQVCPPVDILEFMDEYVINMSIPGALRKDIEVVFDFDKYFLIISGVIQKYPEEYFKNNVRLCERPMGKFERYIPLPQSPRINEREIRTTISEGILTLRISKHSDDMNLVHIPV